MTELSYLVAPAITFAVAAGSPGPATLAVAATAMSRGRRAGLLVGAGLALGLAFWGMIAAAGLGAVILTWAPALLILRVAGGLFLLWLAWQSARAALSADRPAAPPIDSARHFVRGLFLNLLNPKAVLAWGAVIAIGLPTEPTPWQIAIISGTCAVLGWTIYVLYALLFSTAGAMAVYDRARRRIDAASAVLFGLGAIRLLTWRPVQ